ncbi:hypothetical protein FCT18_09080 [Lysinibacillus sphaericus]|uniref:Phospholipase A2 domain-containing protein n=1 Tax=Lysinibacillus sphaericus TaxID=1421 RepID=A0A2S0JZQ7_LYSSH|nr:hypothetical protein [Lysinibacillus sphaericus]AVK96576.1 hypothetical protein LS41612_10020 [Lysinibacillus sphaericus]MED4542893.1 hypothetical protein [Lysinibacillus sphaericus]TKI19819.1 hypothetical protein FCT18_09080 [Lysinibacillus sphaericus]SUV17625.1 Uncharacterised protein [Lysinibacillus sphaericus]GEC81196.1 hypothetical protein LSP03_09390 [Lysinibacillus sphaericus]
MNITDIRVRKVLSDGVSTLDQQSQALLTKALDKLNKEELFNAPKIEQVDYETTYSVYAFNEFNEQNKTKVKQKTTFLQFNNFLIGTIFKTINTETNRTSYLVKVVSLDIEQEIKKTIMYLDDELLNEWEQLSSDSKLTIPEDYKNITSDDFQDDDVLSAQGWGLPCLQNGCCSFRYKGNPFNPLVRYNWCGANCGSGPTVNALDNCCKYHDYCYDANTKYPERCGCDRIIIECANQTDEAGTSRIVGAFSAKMVAMGC